MGTFLVYALQVAVFMSVLYCGYRLALSDASCHRFNRATLLMIYAVSFLLPMFITYSPGSNLAHGLDIGSPLAILSHHDMSPSAYTENFPLTQLSILIQSIYAFGICVAMIIVAISALKLARLMNSGYPIREFPEVMVSPLAPGPFGWGNTIMIRPDDIDSDLPFVVAHERVHLKRKHWIDLIIAHTAIAFQWFNPAAYLMIRELRIVHEYEVDEVVSRPDPYRYQMMLIKKAVGSGAPTFADSLNSQLKLRITMMLSKKSSGYRPLAALALVPMAAIAVAGLSQPPVADLLSSMKDSDNSQFFSSQGKESSDMTDHGKVNDLISDSQIISSSANESTASPMSHEQNEEVFSTPEQLPEFPGGMTALLQFLRDNIKYPENQKNDVRVIVRFTVFKDGSLGDYNILKTGGEECDKEVIRVLNLSPRWTPGKNNGKNVACSFALPVNFKMTEDNTVKSNTPE